MIGAVVGLVLAASGSVDAAVQVRAGYDSNLFFGAEQVLAEPPGPEEADDDTSAVARDGFVAVHPSVDGALQLGRFQLGGAYDVQLTQFGSYDHGYFLVQRAALTQQVQVGRASLGLFEQGDEFDLSALRSDRLQRLLFGPSAALLLGPFDLALRVELGVRHFPYREIAPEVTEDDRVGAVSALARWNLASLALDASVRIERRESNAHALDGDFEQAQLGASWGRGRLQLTGLLDLERLGLGRFPTSDTERGRQDCDLDLQASASVRLGAFSPGVEISWQRGFSNYPPAAFQRVTAGIELAWHWSWRSDAQRPALRPLSSGRYRLEVAIPGARQVFAVGSFEGWKSPGVRMREEAPGRFAVELDLKPGRYRYQLVVDGARQSPPGAEGYEPDGLGGTDGIFTVGASEAEDVR